MAQLDLKLEKHKFIPGGALKGAASWRFHDANDAAEGLELRLFWHTRGPGDTDSEVVKTLPIEDAAGEGSKRFAFRLPDQPYSLQGKCIELVWGVELVVRATNESHHVEFCLSPTGDPIVLGTARVSKLEGLIMSRFTGAAQDGR